MKERIILLVLTLTVASLLVGVGTVSADGPDYDDAEGPDQTDAPRLMEVSEDGSRVFVALAGSDEILIINTTNDEVVKRVPSYGDDPRDMKVVGENRLLVPNWGSGNVALVNTSTGNVGLIQNFTASVGEQPWAIETTTTEDKGEVAVVASWNGTEDDRGTITFINITDFVVDDIVEIPSTNDGGPWGVATCPPPNPIYFTNDGDDITVRMTFDPFRLDIVGMGELPWDAGCIPNPRGSGSILAVANGGSDAPPGSEKVDVIGGKVPIGWTFEEFNELSNEEQKQAESLFKATDQGTKYVRNRSGDATVEIMKVNEQGGVKDRIVVPIASNAAPADKEPWGISFSEDGDVFMTDMHLNTVFSINSSTGDIEGKFSTGEAPRDAVSANGKLYVANSGTHEISSKEDGFDYTENVTTSGSIGVHDLETRNKIKTLSLGDEPLFTEPLVEDNPSFAGPPTNTEELDPNLYEDLNGDGDGLDPTQSLQLWSEFVGDSSQFDDLTQAQVDALDWNGDSDLTSADMVVLWSDQVRASSGSGNGESATASSENVTVSDAGNTSAITVDADEGLGIANVEVSIDTSVAEIQSVQEGGDVNSSQNAQTFSVVNETSDSVRVEYNNILARGASVSDFELAVVEFEATGSGNAPIELAEDGIFDGNSNEYSSVAEQAGTLTVSGGSGQLSPENPFADANGNPVPRQTAINKVLDWNSNGEIDGTPFPRSDIIDFIVQWNLANSN